MDGHNKIIGACLNRGYIVKRCNLYIDFSFVLTYGITLSFGQLYHPAAEIEIKYKKYKIIGLASCIPGRCHPAKDRYSVS